MGKICKNCQLPNDYPMNKLCRECYYEHIKTKKRTPVKKVSDKKKTRLKETGGEKPMFQKIYEHRKICEICGRHVAEPKSWCFGHILSKKDYPHLRLFENNISFVCSINCHHDMDGYVTGTNKKELEQRILNGDIICIKNLK